MSDFLAQSDRGEGKRVFSELAASGDLKQEDFEQRWILWVNLYNAILKSVFVTEELTPSEAEVALGIGLSVWGISEAKAKKLISRPLIYTTVE
jgi:hypothetical protein